MYKTVTGSVLKVHVSCDYASEIYCFVVLQFSKS